MDIRNTSAKGRKFIRDREGNPLTCYLDPAGVATIGPGLTNRSAVVTEMLGRLKPGKTKITAGQADQVFVAVLDREVEPAVFEGMPKAEQHEFDAGASGGYNLGAKQFMGWHWADLWRSGRKHAAALYLASHYNTAAGKKLPGLVKRRQDEALLLEKGVYRDAGISEGKARKASDTPRFADPVVEEAQRILTERGFNPGAIDGWMGKKTRAAVLAYQQAHPHLVNDGILGPATLAQLRRDAAAAQDIFNEAIGKGGGGAAGAGLVSFLAGWPWQWIAAAVVIGVIGWAIWKHRDVIQRRFNTLTGRRIEV